MTNTPLKPSEPPKLEEQVVKECTTFLRKNAWATFTMFTGGIPIGGGRYAANPCKGIPDCLAFNLEQSRMVWIEYKKEKGGILSPEQKIWYKLLVSCNQEVYIVNNLETLRTSLGE